MVIPEYFAVFPDGDRQEISGPLRIDTLVDLNGRPLPLPLPTNRLIAYRVTKIRHIEERGEDLALHYLELVGADELLAYTRRRG